MKAVLISVVLAVTVFLALAQDQEQPLQPCYDYEMVMKTQKEVCAKCRESNKERHYLCLYKEWGMTDKDGNLLTDGNLLLSAMTEFYENGLRPDKTNDIRNALKDCEKNITGPLTDRKKIVDLWNCADAAVEKVCPEFTDHIKEWMTHADLKECFGYE